MNKRDIEGLTELIVKSLYSGYYFNANHQFEFEYQHMSVILCTAVSSRSLILVLIHLSSSLHYLT